MHRFVQPGKASSWIPISLRSRPGLCVNTTPNSAGNRRGTLFDNSCRVRCRLRVAGWCSSLTRALSWMAGRHSRASGGS